jgi:hypothetical protein
MRMNRICSKRGRYRDGIHAIHIFFDYEHFKPFLDFPEFDDVKYFLEHINVCKKLDAEPPSR